ncbi:hypothetical protein cyc_06837 [Cyclospora cayetanensis]|uniref:Uncharacterized protein n=1 Tax=Cyclospora cayetanensis TaxID=88456 RepID=A0A1D3D373_9EIME|nr:hypothetical protein cyc_06837 [Cyclospora cayetanensis]
MMTATISIAAIEPLMKWVVEAMCGLGVGADKQPIVVGVVWYHWSFRLIAHAEQQAAQCAQSVSYLDAPILSIALAEAESNNWITERHPCSGEPEHHRSNNMNNSNRTAYEEEQAAHCTQSVFYLDAQIVSIGVALMDDADLAGTLESSGTGVPVLISSLVSSCRLAMMKATMSIPTIEPLMQVNICTLHDSGSALFGSKAFPLMVRVFCYRSALAIFRKWVVEAILAGVRAFMRLRQDDAELYYLLVWPKLKVTIGLPSGILVQESLSTIEWL